MVGFDWQDARGGVFRRWAAQGSEIWLTECLGQQDPTVERRDPVADYLGQQEPAVGWLGEVGKTRSMGDGGARSSERGREHGEE